MKKTLNKRTNTVRQSLQAYVCNCSCGFLCTPTCPQTQVGTVIVYADIQRSGFIRNGS